MSHYNNNILLRITFTRFTSSLRSAKEEDNVKVELETLSNSTFQDQEHDTTAVKNTEGKPQKAEVEEIPVEQREDTQLY